MKITKVFISCSLLRIWIAQRTATVLYWGWELHTFTMNHIWKSWMWVSSRHEWCNCEYIEFCLGIWGSSSNSTDRPDLTWTKVWRKKGLQCHVWWFWIHKSDTAVVVLYRFPVWVQGMTRSVLRVRPYSTKRRKREENRLKSKRKKEKISK